MLPIPGDAELGTCRSETGPWSKMPPQPHSFEDYGGESCLIHSHTHLPCVSDWGLQAKKYCIVNETEVSDKAFCLSFINYISWPCGRSLCILTMCSFILNSVFIWLNLAAVFGMDSFSIWLWNAPHRPACLNIWLPAGDAVLELWRLAGGSGSVVCLCFWSAPVSETAASCPSLWAIPTVMGSESVRSEAATLYPSLRDISTVMGGRAVSPKGCSDELFLLGNVATVWEKQYTSSPLLLSRTLPQPQAERKYAAHVLAEGRKM